MDQEEITINFTSGRSETVTCYHVRTIPDPPVLSLRVTYDGAYNAQWKNFPLANIESWGPK